MSTDVVVVGAGNAALCAALAAREGGAEVLVLEKAPQPQRGGNSYYTGGLMRFPYDGVADLVGGFPELAGEGVDRYDLQPYTVADFHTDMARTTDYRVDPDLLETLVDSARETVGWLHGKGVRFIWTLGYHSLEVDGRFRFWGSTPVLVSGGGAGLVDQLFKLAQDSGVKVEYGARAVELLGSASGPVQGVRVERGDGEVTDVPARAVVLAAGGFQANAAMRAQYLGPDWDLAKVRGTPYNTGDGITMALRYGAASYGHWSGCHAVAWDANAGPTGDRRIGDGFSRHSYPLSIVVNREGRRFLDEGADFQTHTYAKYGAEILRQPGLAAFQIFDAKVARYLRGEYRMREASRVSADTVELLAKRLEIDPAALARTIDEYNAAVQEGQFDPNILDGKSTSGIWPPKSNWALTIDTPPFQAFPVSTGITFTFGGVRVDRSARVMSTPERPIRGLFAAGEMVGGLFYHNYPSGTGLTAGAVFGRAAGSGAARVASGKDA
jgi:tricarballylate dehydrogenase